MSVRVCVIYPVDPLRPTAGGVASLINGFIRYAPDDFDLEFVGATSDTGARPLRRWTRIEVDDRTVRFAPVLAENPRAWLPISLRFTLALGTFRHDYQGTLLVFHGVEPAILFRNRQCSKVLFVHNDVEKQIARGQGEVWWGRAPRLYFWFEKRVMPFMDRVYTESGQTLGLYRSRYAGDAGKFAFLPTWVDDAVFSPGTGSKIAARAALCSRDGIGPADARWVLFTGRFHEQKNPIGMVRAFFEYQQRDPRSILILIGAGTMRPGIVRCARQLGIASKTFVLPERRQADLADYYRSADVFLLASHYEGMSVSVLEALASGLPVVSTDAGEVRRVVRSGWSGEVADDDSPAALAGCIEKVVSDPGAYSARNCVEAVSAYTARAVLPGLYGALRQLRNG